MLSLQTIAWPEVRFVSIDQNTVRVVIGEKVHFFTYASREEMERELQSWFERGMGSGAVVSLPVTAGMRLV